MTDFNPFMTTALRDHTPPRRFLDDSILKPVLKVLGLGGGGSNAVNRMVELNISDVEFIAANTDHQALQACLAPVKLHLGPKRTRGLGAGGDPTVGQAAAEESWRQISEVLEGADMVFLTAGMGGGTGTGSIPVAAKIARNLGAVTIAIVTMPFSFEIGQRQKNASQGLARLQPTTDTLIAIPNDRLLYVASKNLPLDMAFRMADDVLRQAVQGITELITQPGKINVDFANIRHLMKLGGGALMSIGQGEGEHKALMAIEKALNHPLLETTSLEHAAGILVNFTCGEDLSILEVEEAMTFLREKAGQQVEIVFGIVDDERLQNRLEVILVATGLGAPTLEETLPGFTTNRTIQESHQPASKEPEPVLRQIKDETLPPIRHTVASQNQNLDLPTFLRRPR